MSAQAIMVPFVSLNALASAAAAAQLPGNADADAAAGGTWLAAGGVI
ncbi:MAG TPA: hypothetical protein VGY48_35790 [Vicinamibacterales bacterium]|jgi:hypothetical protein|nr:hypothetical protein [Vicinamibacterales bacterium]